MIISSKTQVLHTCICIFSVDTVYMLMMVTQCQCWRSETIIHPNSFSKKHLLSNENTQHQKQS